MKRLALILASAFIATFAFVGLIAAGPANASTTITCKPGGAVLSGGTFQVCVYPTGSPYAPPSKHAPTAKQKAWSSWSHSNRTSTGWKAHHLSYWKTHSHSSRVKAFDAYDKSHTYTWWTKNVWNKR